MPSPSCQPSINHEPDHFDVETDNMVELTDKFKHEAPQQPHDLYVEIPPATSCGGEDTKSVDTISSAVVAPSVTPLGVVGVPVPPLSTIAAVSAPDPGKPHHAEGKGTINSVSLNTLCNIMGAGVLSLPYAMHNGSIIISFILLIGSGVLAMFGVYVMTYACEVTKKFSYTECLAYTLFPDGPLTTHLVAEEDIDEGVYDPENETKERRYRRWVTMLMECIILLNNFGALVIYARVIADSIPPVLKSFFSASGFWTSSALWLIAPAVLFFALSCVKQMDELKWTSLVGFLTILYIVIVVIVRYFTNLYDPIDTDPDVDEIHLVQFQVSVFSTFSAYALAFGYHFNVPYFYKELRYRSPAKMMETVKTSFPLVIVCYGATGLLGYLTFGALVASDKAEGNIVNNFDDDDIAMNIGRIGLFFHFASVYPILSVCARRGLHRFVCLLFLKPPTHHELKDHVVLRDKHKAPPGDPSSTSTRSIVIEALILVSLGTVLAAFVPGIGIVVEFIGTLFGIPLMLIFPGIIGYRIFDPNISVMKDAYCHFSKIMSMILLGCGVVFLICGIVALVYLFV